MKKTPEPFDTLLVRLFCQPHGNAAATVVRSRDGLELKSITGVHPIKFESEQQRAKATGGHRSAESVVTTISTPLIADDLTAQGCKRCGPIAVDLKTLLPKVQRAVHTGQATRLVL